VAVRRRVIARGRVQGVYFRGATAEQARAAGVAGWVRNLRDGRVEAVFEGPDEAVESVVAWCRRGPRGARVDDLAVEEEPAEGLHGFEIRH
jgi:acylphosphatase